MIYVYSYQMCVHFSQKGPNYLMQNEHILVTIILVTCSCLFFVL